MKRRIVHAFSVSMEKPPLRRHAIDKALSRCKWMDDDLVLSWRYFRPRGQGGWNQYGPPLEWLIEVIRHVNRYVRENNIHS